MSVPGHLRHPCICQVRFCKVDFESIPVVELKLLNMQSIILKLQVVLANVPSELCMILDIGCEMATLRPPLFCESRRKLSRALDKR